MSLATIADALFLRSQGVTAGLALAVAGMSVPLWQRLTHRPTAELSGLAAAIFSATIAGRFAWLATTARPQLTNPIDVVRVNTGIDMLTAAWVFAVSCSWLGRRRSSELGQYAGWALLLAPAAYAAGCLLRRDCAGRTAPSPVGMTFSGYSQLRVPIGLYEAMALVVGLALLLRFRSVLLNSPYFALALLGLIEWTVEFGRIEQLTRATLGVRSLWLASSAVAFFVAWMTETAAGGQLRHKVVGWGDGEH